MDTGSISKTQLISEYFFTFTLLFSRVHSQHPLPNLNASLSIWSLFPPLFFSTSTLLASFSKTQFITECFFSTFTLIFFHMYTRSILSQNSILSWIFSLLSSLFFHMYTTSSLSQNSVHPWVFFPYLYAYFSIYTLPASLTIFFYLHP